MTEEEAVELVQSQAATDEWPQVDATKVLEFVRKNKRAREWAATTAFAFGEIVAPTVRMGHYFRVVVGGTTGATEPPWSPYPRSYVYDGTVVLQEVGPDSSEIYDTDRATSAVWGYKAGLIAGKYNVSADGQTLNRAQAYEHFKQQERDWAPVVFA